MEASIYDKNLMEFSVSVVLCGIRINSDFDKNHIMDDGTTARISH